MEGEIIQTEEHKGEVVVKKKLDPEFLEWLSNHELADIISNFENYKHKLTLDELCDNYSDNDLRELCDEVGIQIIPKRKFVKEIAKLRERKKQFNDKINENPKIKNLIDKIEHCFTQIKQQPLDNNPNGETQKKKDELEKEIENGAKWFFDQIKCCKLVLLENVHQRCVNVDEFIRESHQRKKKILEEMSLTYQRLQEFLKFRDNHNNNNNSNSNFNLNLNTNVENIELQLNEIYQLFQWKFNEFLQINNNESEILAQLPSFHCHHDDIQAIIHQHMFLKDNLRSSNVSCRYVESREAMLDNNFLTIERSNYDNQMPVITSQCEEEEEEKKEEMEFDISPPVVEGDDNNSNWVRDNRRSITYFNLYYLPLITKVMWFSAYHIFRSQSSPIIVPLF